MAPIHDATGWPGVGNAGGRADAERYEMGTNRSDGLEADVAERLLAGYGGQPWRLAQLLAAAAAPARPHELAGEDAAVVAFRSADQTSGVHRRQRSRPAWARLLTAKVAGVAAVVVTAGGVAVAAGTGVLPSPLGGGPATTSNAPGSNSPAGTTAVPGGAPGLTTGPGAQPPATPDPALPGLCHAYLAQLADNPGKARSGPAFAALAEAAGGADHVTTFCEDLAAAQPGPAPPTPGQTTGRPTEPAGQPTATREHARTQDVEQPQPAG